MSGRRPYWVLVRNGFPIIVGNDDPSDLLSHADDIIGPFDSWAAAVAAKKEVAEKR